MADGKVIKVQRIPGKEPKEADWLEALAELCLHYPAYKLHEAKRLPHKRVQMMLRKARQLEAARYYNLTQIAAAPHTEKGKGVNDLLSNYEEIMNG